MTGRSGAARVRDPRPDHARGGGRRGAQRVRLGSASGSRKGCEIEQVSVPAHARNPPVLAAQSPPISRMNGRIYPSLGPLPAYEDRVVAAEAMLRSSQKGFAPATLAMTVLSGQTLN